MSKYQHSRSERKRLGRIIRKHTRKAKGLAWKALIGRIDEGTKEFLSECAGFHNRIVSGAIKAKNEIQAEK